MESTLTLLEATKEDYDDTNVRNTKFTVNGKETEIVDFADNAGENAIFENSCEDAGGRYVKLNYEAICKKSSMTVRVLVKGHPRCYATVCKADDEQILFEDYTLRLTEERNDGDWTCTGELNEEVQTGTGENPLTPHPLLRKFQQALESPKKETQRSNQDIKQSVKSRPTLLMNP